MTCPPFLPPLLPSRFPSQCDSFRGQVSECNKKVLCAFLGRFFLDRMPESFNREKLEARLSEATGTFITVDGRHATGVVEENDRDAAQARLVKEVRPNGSLIS